jgi:hypothetical protein
MREIQKRSTLTEATAFMIQVNKTVKFSQRQGIWKVESRRNVQREDVLGESDGGVSGFESC